MKLKSTIVSAVSVMALAGLMTPMAASALNIPCSTAKLIVPWKAGGGTQRTVFHFRKKPLPVWMWSRS